MQDKIQYKTQYKMQFKMQCKLHFKMQFKMQLQNAIQNAMQNSQHHAVSKCAKQIRAREPATYRPGKPSNISTWESSNISVLSASED